MNDSTQDPQREGLPGKLSEAGGLELSGAWKAGLSQSPGCTGAFPAEMNTPGVFIQASEATWVHGYSRGPGQRSRLWHPVRGQEQDKVVRNDIKKGSAKP